MDSVTWEKECQLILKEKINVVGYDINHKTYEKLKTQNIELTNSLETLMKKSDIIITMLPDGLLLKKFGQKL